MLLTLLGKYIDNKEKREIRLSDKTRANAKKMANYEDTQVKALLPKAPPSPMDSLDGTEKPIEVLGKIYEMLKLMDEDNKLDREMVQTHLESEEHEKNKRNKEIIQALTGRKTGKKGTRMKARDEKKKKDNVDGVIKKEEQKLKDMSTSLPETTVGKTISTGTKVAKVATGAAILGSAGGISGAIAKGESAKASYNASNMGTKGNKIIPSKKQEDIEHTPIGEIMRRQAIKWGDANESEKLLAVGKYQMIPGTLSDAVKSMGISKDALLDGPLQEKIFKEYLIGPKNPAIAKYINSTVDDPILLKDALRQLSREWASIADPDIPGGRTSHYGNGNKASLTVDDATMLLRKDREDNMKLKATPTNKNVPDVNKMSTELDANRKAIKEQSAAANKETNQTNVHNEEVGPPHGEQKKTKDTNPMLEKGKK